jgi:hypothetical protein
VVAFPRRWPSPATGQRAEAKPSITALGGSSGPIINDGEGLQLVLRLVLACVVRVDQLLGRGLFSE